MPLRLHRIQKGGNAHMPIDAEQLMKMIKRQEDPSIPQTVKDADMTLLVAEADQIMAQCGELVDTYVSQVKAVVAEGTTPEKSMYLLATYLYVTGMPCGEIHNMFVAAIHKLAGAIK